MNDHKITASCHYQSVHITINAKPNYINDCNCSLCCNSGAIWGYYRHHEVKIKGATSTYKRTDRANAAVQIHSCKNCSATTHWTLTEDFLAQNNSADNMGVNMRLFKAENLQGTELRFPDGRAWDGISDYSYRKKAIIL